MKISHLSLRHGRKLLAAGLLATLSSGVAQAQVASVQCDNQKFLSDQAGFLQTGPTRVDLPEHVCGEVVSVTQRSRRTRSGVHGYFVMQVAPGRQIRIVSDLDRMQAPDWPWVRPGDPVEVVGRYYFDSARSQGIDWTHHGTGRHWASPGYVQVNGKRYE
ncbi:DUF3465 domain-containing protein [Asaia siamensis]|uniref:DUF3465 domain-containing protein n=1 Tax=Asaia siamensis TaxID=110479 RepID=A0ABQ1LAD1_9PROT|nr:DUF3465 domain-containing protein [Asaia siamensis]GBR09062.1 hypothetical protein AA0323_2345 [Asaia siamensis NRIC 0323]GGC21058.1 hypothetical protein GCM10007207_02840 [Asaia siamensis]